MVVNSLLVLLVSIVLTMLIRQYALKRKVLDIPNQRSSHLEPTPRGGGLAIVLAFIVALAYDFLHGQLDLDKFTCFLSGLLIAAIGFWDDHSHISARWRFLVHFFASLAALYFLQELPPFNIGQWQFNLGLWGYILGAFFLVWWLNLFNFMDGTDGIAASEAIFVSAALAFMLYDVDAQLFKVSVFLTSAAAGFLFWNRPPARIFMGDVGSGFLGFTLGLLVLMAAKLQPILLTCGMILFGVFFVDATYTLLYRFLTGQKWYEAHCSHTYQIAAKRYGHLKLLLVVWSINLFWLLPVSLWVFHHAEYNLMVVLVAYTPLVYLAYKFKAGSPN